MSLPIGPGLALSDKLWVGGRHPTHVGPDHPDRAKRVGSAEDRAGRDERSGNNLSSSGWFKGGKVGSGREGSDS